jgi:predicted transcriptional regulator
MSANIIARHPSAAVAQARNAEILAAICSGPGLLAVEVAHRWRMTQKTASGILTKLGATGAIRPLKSGTRMIWVSAAKFAERLAEQRAIQARNAAERASRDIVLQHLRRHKAIEPGQTLDDIPDMPITRRFVDAASAPKIQTTAPRSVFEWAAA